MIIIKDQKEYQEKLRHHEQLPRTRQAAAFRMSVVENHAQLVRFVVRGSMTYEEAAERSIKHADALCEALCALDTRVYYQPD